MNKAPRVCVQTVVVQCRGRTRSLTVCLHALLIACFSPPMQSDYAVCILLCYPAAPRGGKLRRLFDVCLLLASWGLGRLLGCLRYVYCLLMPPPRSPQEEGEASVGICCQRDSMRPLLQARALTPRGWLCTPWTLHQHYAPGTGSASDSLLATYGLDGRVSNLALDDAVVARFESAARAATTVD